MASSVEPAAGGHRSPAAGSARLAVGLAASYLAPLVVSRLHLAKRIDWALWEYDPSLSDLFGMVSGVLGASYGAGLVALTGGIAIGFLVRTLARARVRAGLPDPLDALRQATREHPMGTAVATALPAFVWSALMARYFLHTLAHRHAEALLPGLVLPGAIALLAHVVLARRGLSALLRPTLDESEATEEQRADGFTFDAVAVTRETRAAVGGLAALSAVMAAVFATIPLARVKDPAVMGALATYVVVTLGAAVLFRRASRVSVGLDGILVRGSSRARFYGFRDVSLARVRGSDIELVGQAGVVLRLQLHGKDASRRAALLGRIEAAIARARADRDDPATSFVSGSSSADIGRAASGSTSYRQAAVSREQLWAVLEGPAIDPASRRAAAEAIAGERRPEESARLRVVAERCAEPSVRVRLHELLEDEPEEAPRPAATRRIEPNVG